MRLWRERAQGAGRVVRRTLSQRQLPEHISLYLATGLSRTGRSALATAAAPARSRRRRKVAESLPPDLSESQLRWVDGDWRSVAGPGSGRTADRANEHLASVAELLAPAGIDVTVTHRSRRSFSVAIPAEQMSQALAALRNADVGDLLHLGRGAAVERLGDTPVLGDIDQVEVWRYREAGQGLVTGRREACSIDVDSVVEPVGTIEAVGLHLDATAQAIADTKQRTMPFPIDAVYSWVDGSDPAWLEAFDSTSRDSIGMHVTAANRSRYADHGELRYSLRSLWENTDFVRTIWIVTADQVPSWLAEHPQIRVVSHRQILDESNLPTFNSHAIEANLHRIEGLAEHYLYLNDDFFFAGPSLASDFFAADGTWRFFPDDRPIGDGPANLEDEPEEAAAKNGRDVMADMGYSVTHKLRHIPYAQRRSVVAGLARAVPLRFSKTSSHRFRDVADLSVAASLVHHYGEANGVAERSPAKYEYINVINRWARHRLQLIARDRDLDFFCINETQLEGQDAETIDDLVNGFLESYFPSPSPFERT